VSIRRQRAIREVGEPSIRGCLYNVLYTVIFCAVGIGAAILLMRDVTTSEWLSILPTFLVANLVEYGIHRWPMHRNIGPMAFMLKLHMVHHNYFDENEFSVATFEDYEMVVFPPFVLNMLSLAVTLPLAGIAYLVAGMNVAMIFIATVMGYYLLMQLLHVFAHIPKGHLVHRIPGVDYIRNHHCIHHDHSEMANANFNFIIPISDWLFGTSRTEGRNRSALAHADPKLERDVLS